MANREIMCWFITIDLMYSKVTPNLLERPPFLIPWVISHYLLPAARLFCRQTLPACSALEKRQSLKARLPLFIGLIETGLSYRISVIVPAQNDVSDKLESF
jgi:hypothetical protein